MLEFSLICYLRLFFLEPHIVDKWDVKNNPLDRRSFEIQFNNRKVNFMNVKRAIDSKREEDNDLFVDITKSKMFEGVAGWNHDYKGTLLFQKPD